MTLCPLDRSLPDVLERFIEVGAASPKGACDAGEPKHLSPRSHDSLSPACRAYANYHRTNKLTDSMPTLRPLALICTLDVWRIFRYKET